MEADHNNDCCLALIFIRTIWIVLHHDKMIDFIMGCGVRLGGSNRFMRELIPKGV